MTEALNSRQPELILPPESDLPNLSVKDLHSLWRQNEGSLVQLASSSDLGSIPALAAHGSAAERIQSLMQRDDPMMWVFAAHQSPQDTEELLRNLYCLASGSSSYSFFANEGRGNIRGEAGIILFGVNSSGQFMTPEGEPHDSWSNVCNKDSFFPQAMPRTCRLPRQNELADFYGYMAEPLDSGDELSFFDFRKNPPKIIAYDRFIPRRQDQRIPIFDAETPKYLLGSMDRDPIIDSYRKEILRRLFCQNLVATMLSRLRISGSIQEKTSTASEQTKTVDEVRASLRSIKP